MGVGALAAGVAAEAGGVGVETGFLLFFNGGGFKIGGGRGNDPLTCGGGSCGEADGCGRCGWLIP